MNAPERDSGMANDRMRTLSHWRISSRTNQNLLTAFSAGRWGSKRNTGIGSLKVGDGLAFYCSLSGDLAGYTAIGVVTQELFVERDRVWLDDLYPFRVRFELTLGPVEARVTKEDVKSALGGARLKHLRPAGIIRLDEYEFRAIEILIQAASRGMRNEPPNIPDADVATN